MKKSTKILIAVCALVAVAIAACAAISVCMTKACEKNKPCRISFDLRRRKKDDEDGDFDED